MCAEFHYTHNPASAIGCVWKTRHFRSIVKLSDNTLVYLHIIHAVFVFLMLFLSGVQCCKCFLLLSWSPRIAIFLLITKTLRIGWKTILKLSLLIMIRGWIGWINIKEGGGNGSASYTIFSKLTIYNLKRSVFFLISKN